ncbi:MAG TPA: T9SS C-terminal target domain-containing protein [Prevotella sp.]|nr:T9SS C-terminal target domain-containing protein [Prevotella sp.]
MMKNILKIFLFAFVLIGIPTVTRAHLSAEIAESSFDEITITVSQNVLHVTNANGEVLNVYNLAGVRVMNVKIEGPDKRFDLNLPKGIYIFKVGNVVRKLSIR